MAEENPDWSETLTPNYKWIKPDIGGDASTWGNVLNTTFDAIDAMVFTNQTNMGNYLPLAGGTVSGDLIVSGAFSAVGTATFGTVNAVSVTASGTVQAATLFSTGDVDAFGNVAATGNVTGNNAVYAGAGGFSTNGPLTANGGVNAGASLIQTTGNVSSNSVTTNTVTTGNATYFFHNTYGDFGTNINPANNSRWLQFATGWSIQAVINSSAYFFYIGGNVVGTLDYTGSLVIYNQGYKPGGGSWAASSDERVKRDIEPYRLGLDELNRLNPVSFAYNGKGGTQDDGKRYVGLIAQMTQQAMPSLVHELPGEFEGKLDGQVATDTSELVFALVNAVRELSARVAELEAAR